jgi:signal transduction histidine kinase
MAHKHTLRNESLFIALAEDLKTPLTRIAYHAEVAALEQQSAENIQHAAKQALALLDAYVLGMKGASQTTLQLEPVDPSAILYDAAHELREHAKKFSCQVLLDTAHSHKLVLSHKQALTSAVANIARVLIEAQDAIGAGAKHITLASYRTTRGMAVGVFYGTDRMQGMHEQLLSRARSHVGVAARPFVGFASGASSHLFAAEQLLESVDSRLRTARRGAVHGLAFDLSMLQQLTLV